MAKLAYQKVYESIRKDIENGTYSAGSLLPVEAKLQEQYAVSRTTIRKAMRMLAEENFVDVMQGRGTMVLKHKVQQNLNQVTSVTESLQRQGYKITTKGVYIDIFSNDESLRKSLKLDHKEKIVRMQRIQCADGKPICIMTNYISERNVPELLQEKPQITVFYQYLESRHGIQVEWTNDTIYSSGCSFYESQILEVEVGVPIMGIDRICYDRYDNPICKDEVKILGNWYQIQVTTRGKDF